MKTYKNALKRISRTIQRHRTIDITNALTGTTVTGTSGEPDSCKSSTSRFRLNELKPIKIGAHWRTPFECAEPHALGNLWENDSSKWHKNPHTPKPRHIAEWLENIRFLDFAKDSDRPDDREAPCAVCQQWIDFPFLKVDVLVNDAFEPVVPVAITKSPNNNMIKKTPYTNTFASLMDSD